MRDVTLTPPSVCAVCVLQMVSGQAALLSTHCAVPVSPLLGCRSPFLSAFACAVLLLLCRALGNTSSSLGWPYCGEIDFMEQVNGQSASPNADDFTQFGTLHYNADGQHSSVNAPTQSGGSVTSSQRMWGSDWHVYAFEWNASTIAFSVDGAVYYAAQTADTAGMDSFRNPGNPFYLIVNLAFGGQFPNEAPQPASFPAAFHVDWIRIWQRQDGVSFIVAPDALPPPSSSSAAPPAALSSSSSSSSSAMLPLPASSSSSQYELPAVMSSSAQVRANHAASSGVSSSLSSLLPLLALLALASLC